MRDIAPFGLAVLALMAMFGQLLVQGDIPLLRSLVPEVTFVEAVGELMHIVGGIKHPVLLVIGVHDLVVGALAVEQFNQLPLFGRKAEQ